MIAIIRARPASGKEELNSKEYLTIGMVGKERRSLPLSGKLRKAHHGLKSLQARSKSLEEKHLAPFRATTYPKQYNSRKLDEACQSTPSKLTVRSDDDDESFVNMSLKTTPTFPRSKFDTPDTNYTGEFPERPDFSDEKKLIQSRGTTQGITTILEAVCAEADTKGIFVSQQTTSEPVSKQTHDLGVSLETTDTTNRKSPTRLVPHTIKSNPFRNPIVLPKCHWWAKGTTLLFPYSGGEISLEHEEVYKQMVDCLIQNLETDPKTGPACKDIEFKLWMAGPSETTFHPSIVVIAQKSKISHIKSILYSLHITDRYNIVLPTQVNLWNFGNQSNHQCRSNSPCFNLYLLGRDEPTRILLGNTNINPEVLTGDSDVGLWCGSKISDTRSSSCATLTCFLSIGSSVYGLTAAHPFQHGNRSGQIEVTTLDTEAIRSSSYKLKFAEIKSSEKKTANLDWALVNIPDLKKINPSPYTFNSQGKMTFGGVVSSHPGEERNVLVLASAFSEPISGILICGTTYSRAENGDVPVALWSVELGVSQCLRKGDSGSLVIDAITNEVYGYIVAMDFIGLAQVMPLHNTIKQIQELCGPNEVTLLKSLQIQQKSLPEEGLEDAPSKLHIDTAEKTELYEISEVDIGTRNNNDENNDSISSATPASVYQESYRLNEELVDVVIPSIVDVSPGHSGFSSLETDEIQSSITSIHDSSCIIPYEMDPHRTGILDKAVTQNMGDMFPRSKIKKPSFKAILRSLIQKVPRGIRLDNKKEQDYSRTTRSLIDARNLAYKLQKSNAGRAYSLSQALQAYMKQSSWLDAMAGEETEIVNSDQSDWFNINSMTSTVLLPDEVVLGPEKHVLRLLTELYNIRIQHELPMSQPLVCHPAISSALIPPH